ncbi:MAG: hypothetical protein HOU81_22275 [Hamadaea sp.]|uniref:FtsX-like permease family protein n=1 Tax=Hamadaea sp. TaxID=2024425 RepID=UPI0017CCD3D8|nr:FtsX-like permease family protein [Hamadaea sp.]NUR73556.1 hypothetical protein [Hamadaea sp.]NUT17825.1 hypothetical protein [Hamadaea sp.]
MIRIVRVMLRRRRGTALLVLALSVIASATAAAVPLYTGSAARAVTAAQVAEAAPAELSIARTVLLSHGFGPPQPEEKLAPQLPYRPGFTTVGGLLIGGLLTVPPAAPPVADAVSDVDPVGSPAWLAYRSGVCANVRMVAGRCIAGAGEAIVPESAGRKPGAEIGFVAGTASAGGFRADGDPVGLTVVGVYAIGDLTGAYGAGRSFTGVPQPGEEPEANVPAVFTTLETAAATPFSTAFQTTDLIADGVDFTDDAGLRAVVAQEQTLGEEGGYNVDTTLPELLDRIAAQRTSLERSVQVAAVPLLLLTLVVLYLAVSSSTVRRRTESGLAGLRGVPGFTQWWLSAAETLLPAVAAAPFGLAVGWLGVRVLAAWTLSPGISPQLTWTVVLTVIAAIVTVAALAGVAVAQASRGPIAAQLRGTPARAHNVLIGLAEVCAVLAAAAAGYQITAEDRPGGLALLTPLLTAVAAGLVARRLTGPVAERLGRWGLRRGRVNRAMAAFVIARRPTHSRLLALLVVLFGTGGFAVAATTAGAWARTERAQLDVGAAEVWSLPTTTAGALRDAVRTADPSGRYAMAAAMLPDKRFRVLAVDAGRFCGIGYWGADSELPQEQACAMLHAESGVALPMVTTQTAPDQIAAGSAESVAVTTVAQVSALPRLGTTGGLVDLAGLPAATPVRQAQVWFAAEVPETVRAALRTQGLTPVAIATAARAAEQLDHSGPALALRFYLVACLTAVVLGVTGVLVVGAAEHDEIGRVMRALRIQGMRSRSVPRQVAGGYAVLVVVAAVIGTLVAGLAWRTARGVVPMVADGGWVPRTPLLPERPGLLAVALLGQVVVLLLTSLVVATVLRRSVEGETR